MFKLFDILEKALEILAAIFLGIFCCVSFAQVVVRLLGGSLVWAEEAARYSFIYMVFLGCTVGVRRNVHYCFDIFGKSKNRLIAALSRITALILCEGFCLILFITGIMFIPQMHARRSSILGIPMSVPYMAIVAFAGISILFFTEQFAVYLKSLKNGGD